MVITLSTNVKVLNQILPVNLGVTRVAFQPQPSWAVFIIPTCRPVTAEKPFKRQDPIPPSRVIFDLTRPILAAS